MKTHQPTPEPESGVNSFLKQLWTYIIPLEKVSPKYLWKRYDQTRTFVKVPQNPRM